MSIFIYPVVVHWVWSNHGWLSLANPDAALGGAIDLAGAGPVHLVGGIAGLVGAWIIGPRIGYFDPVTGKTNKIEGHSIVLRGLGCFVLWFGWYGFNCGSTITLVGQSTTAALIAVSSSISACYAGLTAFFLSMYLSKKVEPDALFNGSLVGLVSITAGVATFDLWAAAVCGVGAGFAYVACANIVPRLKIDDPLEAISVHAAGGVWGIICASLFGSRLPNQHGAFFGNPKQLGIGLVEIVVIIAYVSVMATLGFKVIGRFVNLRPKMDQEEEGLDNNLERGAYPELINVMQALDSVVALQKLIDNPKKAKFLWIFHAYLQREYDSAGLDFLLAAKKYDEVASSYFAAVASNAKVVDKKSLSEFREEVRTLFNAICDNYILNPSSESNIPCPDHQKRFIQQFYGASEIAPPNVFELVAEDVRGVLQAGSFKRFYAEYEAARKALVEKSRKKKGLNAGLLGISEAEEVQRKDSAKKTSESTDLDFWKAALETEDRTSMDRIESSAHGAGAKAESKGQKSSVQGASSADSSLKFVVQSDGRVYWKGQDGDRRKVSLLKRSGPSHEEKKEYSGLLKELSASVHKEKSKET
jgi:ammonia channel protein AmtB